MVKYADANLDLVFAALSDPTRRAVLEELSGGTRTVTELSEPHGMTLPGFMKHLRILEDAGLVARAKSGRVVHCRLAAAPMEDTAAWLSRYHKFWTGQLDALGRYLDRQEESTPWPKNPTRGPRSPLREAIRRRPRKSGRRGPIRKR